MRYSMVMLAGTASAFPFMSTDLSAAKRAAMFKDQVQQMKRDTPEARQLSGLLGGGLLGGILQPLSGPLQNVDVPTPQEFSLKAIPGNDPAHQFVAPGPTDVRGMCPTLNTLANHNFISHTGVTTFAEASNACQVAYGFGYGLCTFLSALGLVAGGDLVSGKYSIGGADSRVPNTLGPALGTSKHGTFEIDGSISRPDNYFGNQANFETSRWQTIRKQAEQSGGGYYGPAMWKANQAATYNTARATNPEATLGAKYFAVSLAERAFMFRALPNGTTEEVADAANIEPFFLLNTFPEGWFRRSTAYELTNLAPDLVDLYAAYPFELGQNNGLDSFTPLDEDLSNKTPSDIMCFILTNVFDTVPGQVQPALASNVDLYSEFINAVVTPFFAPFNCPAITTFSTPGGDCNGCAAFGPAADMPDAGANSPLKNIPAPGVPLTNQ